MSSYQLIWSPIARLTYLEILSYLEEKWTIKEVESFIHRTEEVLKYISQNPSLYPYSNESDTHKSVLVKQVSLFYRVKSGKVELLIFWDNRQNLASLLL